MTEHFFEYPQVNLHYYVFGSGPQVMLCFHGYGMHGRQFSQLEAHFGGEYTFYGFDLLFHKQTLLTDDSLKEIKRGISKDELNRLFTSFCTALGIDRFSIIAYSMGTHYGSTLVELSAGRIDRYIAIAPSSIRPVPFLRLLSTNWFANKLLEKLTLSPHGMHNLLLWSHKLRIIDAKGVEILSREIETPRLRLSFYACITYLRFLELDEEAFIASINNQHISVCFIFGRKDKNYPPEMNDRLLARLPDSRTEVLEGGHELVNSGLPQILIPYL